MRATIARSLWVASSPLRAARRDSRLTAKELGEAAGLEPNTIRAYERGIRRPLVETITAIAHAAGLNPAVLLLDDEVWRSLNPMEGIANNDERSVD